LSNVSYVFVIKVKNTMDKKVHIRGFAGVKIRYRSARRYISGKYHTIYIRKGSRNISDISLRLTFHQNDLAIKNKI
jgi:hypothetical protein